MGIDWTQYLAGMQGSVEGQQGQPGGSLFPATPWSNLASAIRAVGVGLAAPKAQAQQQMIQMVNEAAQFGISGLRTLYASPEWQALSAKTGAVTPPLPPLSAAELEDRRKADFLQKLNQIEEGINAGQTGGPTGVPGGGGTPTTYGGIQPGQFFRGQNPPPRMGAAQPAVQSPDIFGQPSAPTPQEPRLPAPPISQGGPGTSLAPTVPTGQPPSPVQGGVPANRSLLYRKAIAQLVSEYPAEAAALGFVPKNATNLASKIIEALTNRNTNIDGVQAAIAFYFQATGEDEESMDPALKQTLAGLINPYMEQQIELLRQRIQLVSAQTGKTNEQWREMPAKFDAEVAIMRQRVQNLISQGKVYEATAAIKEIDAKYRDALDKANIAHVQEETATGYLRTKAYLALVDSSVNLHNAEIVNQYAQARYHNTQVTSNKSGIALKEKLINDMIKADVDSLNVLKVMLPSTDHPQSEINRAIDEKQKEIDQYKEWLLKLGRGEPIPGFDPPTQAGADKPWAPNFAGGSPLLQQVYDVATKNDKNQWVWQGGSGQVGANISQLMKYLKSLPNLKDALKPTDWNLLMNALVGYANSLGIQVPSSALTGF